MSAWAIQASAWILKRSHSVSGAPVVGTACRVLYCPVSLTPKIDHGINLFSTRHEEAGFAKLRLDRCNERYELTPLSGADQPGLRVARLARREITTSCRKFGRGS